MLKCSTFFPTVLIGIALVIFNQGELKAQQAYLYSEVFEYAAMTWNSTEFSYTGFIEGPLYGYFSGVPGISNNEFNFLTFPTGNIYPCCGNPEEIPGGFYEITLNPVTGEYLFVNANTCYGESNVPNLIIYEYDYVADETFCSPTEFYAWIEVNGLEYGSFTDFGLDFQWLRNDEPIIGETELFYDFAYPSASETEVYTLIATCPINGDTIFSNAIVYPSNSSSLEINGNNQQANCVAVDVTGSLFINDEGPYDMPFGSDYQWLRNGVPIPGATGMNLQDVIPSPEEESVLVLMATCEYNSDTILSNEVTLPQCYYDFSSPLNYLLVQNVTTTGNIPGQSVQVQFDLNWGNTWRDDVNWDATWVFMKYKDAQGIWKHCKISPTGFDHGQGTPNFIEPSADQMGAFVRLAQEGTGNFNVDAMQLRWNYGADGLSSVSGLEVRVYAIEMVYVPQGDFSMSAGATAPGNKIPVINARLSPVLSADNDASIRIKGDAGLDLDANGTVDNTAYPTGYYPFYMFKYEMSEQQYADFLNCLTPTQRNTLGVAGFTITQTAGQYFASSPNQVCAGANAERVLAYADWCGLRPMSFLEFHKALNGPKAPGANDQMYGLKNVGWGLTEPYVRISSSAFNRTNHGNGVLSTTGLSNEPSWIASEVGWIYGLGEGFRFCRTAE
jgi:formylglycine-generating enzyme required for sulfatase activity